MATGDVFGEDSPELIQHMDLLDNVYSAGWEGVASGSIKNGYVGDSFYLPDEVRIISAAQLKSELALVGPDEMLEEGHDVGREEDGTWLEYEGLFTPNYVLTLGLLAIVPEEDQYAREMSRAHLGRFIAASPIGQSPELAPRLLRLGLQSAMPL